LRPILTFRHSVQKDGVLHEALAGSPNPNLLVAAQAAMNITATLGTPFAVAQCHVAPRVSIQQSRDTLESAR
jgi:hypothetical protein